MKVVLWLVGGYMLGAGMALVAKPGAITRLAELVVIGPRRYVWALIAGVFGAGLLWAAPASRAPRFIQVLGCVALLKGVVLLILPQAAFLRFVGLPRAVHRLWALVAMAIGIAVLWSG